MKKYISRRLLLGLCVLLGVVILSFMLTRILPADPARKWAGVKASAEQVEAARIELGLDKPVYVQFGKYLLGLLHGDLGYSLTNHRPILSQITEAFPATLELVLVALVFAIVIGVTLGIYSAKYKNKLLDHVMRIFSIGAVSLPGFWIAIALQLVFYGILGILPLGGRVSDEITIFYELPDITGLLLLDSALTGNWVIFKDALRHIILPAIPLAAGPLGSIARLTRSALLEILGEDYITAEKSYGIKERFILWVYALKNSLGPTVTVVTSSVASMLVGTFLVESIFSWPGIGTFISDAILNMDYQAIMAVTLLAAILYVCMNLIGDIIIASDPRVRL